MTNYEYIISKMSVRTLAGMIVYTSYIDGSFPKARRALSKWAKRTCEGCHGGNTYDPNKTDNKMPNPLLWSCVYDIATGEWINFGHGREVSMQMFLEAVYNPDDWE